MAEPAFVGIRVGHATRPDGLTGCTVFLCPAGTIASVDVRGPAPGSRETALLQPDKPVNQVHGLVLSGGSAFGLATADGVMRYLAEQGIGHVTPIRPIPIVPAAIVYDLFLSGGRDLPDADLGYAACQAAAAFGIAQGNVGAGAGVTVGKWAGFATMMKGGFGLAQQRVGELVVCAAAVVNSVGDVMNDDGTVLAGARHAVGMWLADEDPLRRFPPRPVANLGTNTTLVVIATNARLDVIEANRLAQRGHDGLAMAILPVHTSHDGDTVFALATGQLAGEVGFDLVANMAVPVVAEAIRNGVRQAATLAGVPGLADEAGLTVRALDHLVLTVRDVAATTAFYTRVLGMQARLFGEGRTALHFGRQKINLHPAGREIAPHASTPRPGSADLCFLTDLPLKAVLAHLQACQVAVEVGPVRRTGAAGPLESVYVRDPDGNLVELACSPSPEL